MSQVIPFSFENNPVRVQTDAKGDPWFNAADVCAVLGMSNPRQSVETHVDFDDVQKLDAIDNMGRTQLANHVNVSGLYALVFGSTKDAARRFKRWVTSDVLPTIQKTGGYGQPAPLNLRDPRQMVALAAELAQINQELNGQLAMAEQRVAQVEAKVERLTPKAEAFDAFVDGDGVYTLQNAGRILGSNGHKTGPNQFIGWLKERGFLFYQDGALVPYGKFVVQKLFKLKVRDAKGKDRVQTYVTARGIAHFHAILSPQGDLLASLPPPDLTSNTKTEGAA